MSSTVVWADELSAYFQTESYSGETVMTTEQDHADNRSALMSYKAAIIVFGVLGALSNGLVLGGFGLSGRSKMTSSSAHIANHTTLELSPFS